MQVEQVDEASGNAMAEVTTAVVEAILEPLRPAMVAMRANVEVGFLRWMYNMYKVPLSGGRHMPPGG